MGCNYVINKLLSGAHNVSSSYGRAIKLRIFEKSDGIPTHFYDDVGHADFNIVCMLVHFAWTIKMNYLMFWFLQLFHQIPQCVCSSYFKRSWGETVGMDAIVAYKALNKHPKGVWQSHESHMTVS